jgi:glycine betaine/proline transport system ATP-binding protein
LFDEPFSALDPLIRKEMQDELIRLQKSMQRTIIFITHDFAEALRLGDRIAIMKDGSFDQVGTPEEIVSNPATPYVREFVNDVPRAKVLSVRTVTVSGSAPAGSRTVNASDRIETVIPMLLERDEAIQVVDENGTSIGVVNRHNVASMLQAEQR